MKVFGTVFAAGKFIFPIAVMLALAACSDAIILSMPEGGIVATGTLRLRPNPPHRLTIVLDGKTYEGNVDSEKVDDSTDLLKRFGADSKLYQKALMELNTNHNVYLYTGFLKAPDGTTLGCQFLSSYHGGTLGACIDGKGQTYEIQR